MKLIGNFRDKINNDLTPYEIYFREIIVKIQFYLESF